MDSLTPRGGFCTKAFSNTDSDGAVVAYTRQLSTAADRPGATLDRGFLKARVGRLSARLTRPPPFPAERSLARDGSRKLDTTPSSPAGRDKARGPPVNSFGAALTHGNISGGARDFFSVEACVGPEAVY